VKEYLDDAVRLGLQLGVASSSSRAWVTGHLARLGLLTHFASIQCADDVQATKPNPAAYQAVLTSLQVSPAQALALEDSPHGILAAKRAGLWCVAVPNALTRHLPLDRADAQISSLADMSLEQLLLTIQA
jgi:beta-phosphoglucomutase-like phosphatase (HAD superfamily)